MIRFLSGPRARLLSVSATSIILPLALGACSGAGQPRPLVSAIDVQQTGAPDTPATRKLAEFKRQSGVTLNAAHVQPSVVAHVTLSKQKLLGRDFLYGADLQYSSIGDGDYSLILQSMTIGHLIVRFRLIDDRLQLVGVRSHMVESDVNAPERLVHEFPVLRQDAETVTVSFREASPIAATLLSGAEAPAIRSSWVRSAKFVADGEYVMIETSVEQADGTIAELMETFFPRSSVVSPEAQPLFADAELEPLAERFRFLGQGPVWLTLPRLGRVRTEIASRFDWTPGRPNAKPIDWYVTPNVPPEFVSAIRTGVEGWNRYSQAMWGQDIVRFAGPLPSDVAIGDPRFNVINWDSVSEAGAAYESQATDPLTGVQSHSLIYLPQAWVNIGRKYWEAGGPSASDAEFSARFREALKRGRFNGKPLPIRCLREAEESISLKARTSPEVFAKELLKGVLFHEMGHALGLAHNFKGSLTMDPHDPSTAFTSSIMDYNQYQIEGAAYDGLESSHGPLLEYDRQILSVLYAGGRDVRDSDPILPACADSEADDREGGADPLCIRYDAGKDPTAELTAAIDLTRNEEASRRDQRSLLAALRSLPRELPDPARISSEADAKAALAGFESAIKGIVNFYFASGAQSVRYMTMANVRSLYVFNVELPDGYSEVDMRRRATEGLRYVSSLEAFEPPVAALLTGISRDVAKWLERTPYIAALDPVNRESAMIPLVSTFSFLQSSLAKTTLSRLRAGVWSELTRKPSAPFFLDPTPGPQADLEEFVVDTLARAVTTTVSGEARLPSERAAAATALRSFKDTGSGARAIELAKVRLTDEIARARSALARERVRQVLAALN